MLYNEIKRKLIQIGKEIDQTCPMWFDEDLYNAILHEDKDVQDSLRIKYKKMCHEPRAVYYPSNHPVFPNQCHVSCHSCDICSPSQCKRVFPGIAEVFLKEFNNQRFE